MKKFSLAIIFIRGQNDFNLLLYFKYQLNCKKLTCKKTILRFGCFCSKATVHNDHLKTSKRFCHVRWVSFIKQSCDLWAIWAFSGNKCQYDNIFTTSDPSPPSFPVRNHSNACRDVCRRPRLNFPPFALLFLTNLKTRSTRSFSPSPEEGGGEGSMWGSMGRGRWRKWGEGEWERVQKQDG